MEAYVQLHGIILDYMVTTYLGYNVQFFLVPRNTL